MQAVTFTDTDQLSIVEIPRPEPVPTEVLVRVRAAGINPVDWKTRQGGGVRGFFDPNAPMVLGWDVAGVIDFVGGPENPTRSLATLRRGGKLIVIPSPAELPSEEALAERGVTATWLLVEPDHAGLEGLASMLAAGTLQVLIADSKPLSEMAALHALSESGAVTGKLVATLDS